MASEDAGQKGASPPYIAFQSLKTLTSNMKEHGVPGRIDKSVLNNFSGAVGSQIITALKFLDLIDDNNHPKASLKGLVTAYGTDGWTEALSAVLKKAFAPIFSLNLETASPAQFTEHFKQIYDVDGDTLRKSLTFFVNAVRDAQIPISAYIMKNKKPRSAPTKKRTPKPNAEKSKAGGNGNTNSSSDKGNSNPSQQNQKPLSQQLLEILAPESMPDDVQQAILTLLVYLRKEGK